MAKISVKEWKSRYHKAHGPGEGSLAGAASHNTFILFVAEHLPALLDDYEATIRERDEAKAQLVRFHAGEPPKVEFSEGERRQIHDIQQSNLSRRAKTLVQRCFAALTQAEYERDVAISTLRTWVTEQTGMPGDALLDLVKGAKLWRSAYGPTSSIPWTVAIARALEKISGAEKEKDEDRGEPVRPKRGRAIEALGFENYDGVIIHSRDRCAGQHCPFHNPSNHSMKSWRIVIRDSGLVERVCEHGCGHPDPDSLAHLDPDGEKRLGVHGCDGCCQKAKTACRECGDTGVIETGNNDEPCHCPAGDAAIFNTTRGVQTGREIKARGV